MSAKGASLHGTGNEVADTDDKGWMIATKSEVGFSMRQTAKGKMGKFMLGVYVWLAGRRKGL